MAGDTQEDFPDQGCGIGAIDPAASSSNWIEGRLLSGRLEVRVLPSGLGNGFDSLPGPGGPNDSQERLGGTFSSLKGNSCQTMDGTGFESPREDMIDIYIKKYTDDAHSVRYIAIAYVNNKTHGSGIGDSPIRALCSLEATLKPELLRIKKHVRWPHGFDSNGYPIKTEKPHLTITAENGDVVFDGDPSNGMQGTIQITPTVGKKYDFGKPRLTLLPWAALILVAKVMGHGAEKYGDNNWLLVEPKERYEDAMLRHYTAYKSGEPIDPESGHSHLAHMATNALLVLARSL